MFDVFLEALLDTLKLFPFLFAVYILIEVLEHSQKFNPHGFVWNTRAAPLFGAAVGLVPMCGFSVMAAKLYERKYLSLGTLFAVFIATNDEALIVLLLSPISWREKLISITALCVCKLLLGAVSGIGLDLFFNKNRTSMQAAERMGMQACSLEVMGPICSHEKESAISIYIISPFFHALEVFFAIFFVNFGFGALFSLLGEERVMAFLQGAGYWFQPLFASLAGTIPNCASSVVLSQVYAEGGIAFGSLLGGLITNAGIGILFLFRRRRTEAWLLWILGLILGIAAGYVVNALLILF